MTLTGHCQCGTVRFTAAHASIDTELCHCSMCRRAVGNIHMASISVARADIAWEGAASTYASSPIATRGFCARCGTPLWFAYNDSDRLDLMAGVIDQADALRPATHFGIEGRLEAFRHLNDLPEKRTQDDAKIAERWRVARG